MLKKLIKINVITIHLRFLNISIPFLLLGSQLSTYSVNCTVSTFKFGGGRILLSAECIIQNMSILVTQSVYIYSYWADYDSPSSEMSVSVCLLGVICYSQCIKSVIF